MEFFMYYIIFGCICVGIFIGMILQTILSRRNKIYKYVYTEKAFIDEFFDRQIKIQKILGYDFKDISIEERERYTKDTCLYLLEEVHELLRETNFKSHKKVRHPVIIENIRDEIADIQHFVINLAIAWNITAPVFMDSCLNKNDKNLRRIQSSDY